MCIYLYDIYMSLGFSYYFVTEIMKWHGRYMADVKIFNERHRCRISKFSIKFGETIENITSFLNIYKYTILYLLRGRKNVLVKMEQYVSVEKWCVFNSFYNNLQHPHYLLHVLPVTIKLSQFQKKKQVYACRFFGLNTSRFKREYVFPSSILNERYCS